MYMYMYLCFSVWHRAISAVMNVSDSLHPDPTYNILHRLFYSYLVIIYIRCRYYFVWILSDSISNAAGLGFEGYDRLNQAKWGLATNIYVVDMELSMNIRTSINSWNVTSARWLRRYDLYLYMYIYIHTCTIDAWAFKGTATGYISHVPQ